METWEVKKTPIFGLWEIARFDPSKEILETWANRDVLARRINDIAWLDLCGYSSFSDRYLNSVSNNDADEWHSDGTTDSQEFSYLMIIGSRGTEFKNRRNAIHQRAIFPIEIEADFVADPWVLYLMAPGLVHRTPRPHSESEAHDGRFMYRCTVRQSIGDILEWS